MVHANAVLTPRGRLLLARRIVDEGWPIVRAAEHFNVSWPTAKRWASRYAEMGEAGMVDRSSRPHHSPNRTPQPVLRRIVDLRWRHRLSPLAIASRLSMPASTVYAVLVRCRLNRLSHTDIRTGEPIRRYEHDHPGSLIHVDVKKLGNIPNGGSWRFVGRHGSIDRGIDALARRRAQASAADIAGTLRRRAEHRLSPPITGPITGLTDVLVHGADMRIPLAIAHRQNPEHVAWVLDFLTGRTQLGFFPRGRLRGIALIDEDTGRSWGTGDTLVGPGEALILAACGRTAAFDRLTGPAVPVLRARLW